LTKEGQNQSALLPHALAVSLNTTIPYERERHIGAAPYERAEERNGHANGYKERVLSTRLGGLNLSVPQVRGGSGEPFHPRKRT